MLPGSHSAEQARSEGRDFSDADLVLPGPFLLLIRLRNGSETT
ncbi:MAG: hypothetical protein Ct9H300mP11_01790 [Chloroflexota bacterium]|nr:MAG: hypothetical protein Ct9H300mP11_01790 [Chloroflexota bacterium]